MTTTRSNVSRAASGGENRTQQGRADAMSGIDQGGTSRQATATDPVQQAGEKASQATGQVVDSAKDTIAAQANTQKSKLADGVSQLGQAMHRISGELETQQPAIASVADTAAQQAERIGSYLRSADVTDIVRSTEDFARRQPLLFLGGAFALGLVAARFIKAAGGHHNGQTELQPTGPGYNQSYSGRQSSAGVGTRTGGTASGMGR